MAQELASSSVHSRSRRVCTSRSSVYRKEWAATARAPPSHWAHQRVPLGDTHHAQILLGLW